MSVVEVAGVPTYYERHGSGDPLLLLHGGFCSVETFAGMIPGLAASFEVFAPERIAHGRTPDTAAPLSYEAMAAETLGFMNALGIPAADVVGFSDGGNVGLLLATGSPSRVRRLVCISGNFSQDGTAAPAPGSRGDLRPLVVSLEEAYRRLSPDGPGHLEDVQDKTLRMWGSWPGIPTSVLGTIAAPTLVLCADADIVTPEHTLALFRSIPGAELGTVPGTSHNLIQESPALVTAMILDFLVRRGSDGA